MNKLLQFTIILLLIQGSVFSQDSDLQIAQDLEQAGFENLRVIRGDRELTVSLENNIYRWNVRAIVTAMDIIAAKASSSEKVHLILLRYDIPRVMISSPVESWQQAGQDTAAPQISGLEVSYNTGKSWGNVRSLKPLNRNLFKFDFVFYPQFYVSNFTFNTVYEIQFNIAPALQISLWKGMQLTAQVILPIYNDCKVYGEEGNLVRPGFLVFSQDFRLPGPVFGNISVGNFNNYRYGIDLNLTYPFRNPRWEIGLNTGVTGSSVFRKDGWDFGKLNDVTFFFSAGYFLPRFNLRFNASAGRFIYGDYGGRLDLTRMFGETSIGFYAAYSMEISGGEGHPNAGFHFAIPFPPGKRLRHRRLRVDLPHYFDWEYNGAAELVYNRYYETAPDENRSEDYLNPLYLKGEIGKYMQRK